MVLDEELKMMAQVCDGGGQVVGPFLREMSQLAHTEYYIEGYSQLDPRQVLRKTLLAPTVTGSPLENACRIIAEYEPKGRGYYGGVAALIGRDACGARVMDSAILIRTAECTANATGSGHKVAIGVGATLVRHSDAGSEVAETHTKAAGVLKALNAPPAEETRRGRAGASLLQASHDPKIQHAMVRRNEHISDFWLQAPESRATPQPFMIAQKALVIDAQDDFTAMLAIKLQAIGLNVDLHLINHEFRPSDYDLIVLGPGPGDPRDHSDPRIAHLSSVTRKLLYSMHTPFLAVCLSHQLLCQRLGLPIRRRPFPNQGTQREIDLFGTLQRVGYYNSFAAYSDVSQLECRGVGRIKVSRVPETGEVHALKCPHFTSVQFHPESVLTENGVQILTDLLTPIMKTKKALAS